MALIRCGSTSAKPDLVGFTSTNIEGLTASGTGIRGEASHSYNFDNFTMAVGADYSMTLTFNKNCHLRGQTTPGGGSQQLISGNYSNGDTFTIVQGWGVFEVYAV